VGYRFIREDFHVKMKRTSYFQQMKSFGYGKKKRKTKRILKKVPIGGCEKKSCALANEEWKKHKFIFY